MKFVRIMDENENHVLQEMFVQEYLAGKRKKNFLSALS
jgi:hypothetical protein